MKRRSVFIIVGTVTLALIGIGFLAANYYSILADLRENFASVDTSDEYAYGEILFQTRGCVFCHTLETAGSSADVGPNLDGIGSRAGRNYIRASIVNPDDVIADGCSEEPCEAGTMPAYGQILDDAQVNALVRYLDAQE